MTKVAQANQKQKVYECYLAGMTVEQAVNELKLDFKYVKLQYSDFLVYSAKIKANSPEERLRQIACIERELFEAIENNRKDARVNLNDKINQLQGTYSRFLV